MLILAIITAYVLGTILLTILSITTLLLICIARHTPTTADTTRSRP